MRLIQTMYRLAVGGIVLLAVASEPGCSHQRVSRVSSPLARTAKPLSFETASVTPNQSTNFRFRMETSPAGTLSVTNANLGAIIAQAYGVVEFRTLLKGPEWIISEKFDIEGKAPKGVIPAGLSQKKRNEKLMLMLQTLLADRFRLVVHPETRLVPVYSLVVSKEGLELRKARTNEAHCPRISILAASIQTPDSCHAFFGGQGGGIHGKTVDMRELATWLEHYADRPILDSTGDKHLFDIDTEGWVPMIPRPGPTPGAAPSAEDRAFAKPGRPTLQSVLSKVGLKLESTQGSVDVLVIDHVERPVHLAS
jgi:uncharacterized protein (TIGR03435 family)